MIYTDYPTYGFSPNKYRPTNFKLAGDARMCCRLMLVKTQRGKMPEFMITLKGSKELLKGKKTKEGHLEFTVQGDSEIHINWK